MRTYCRSVGTRYSDESKRDEFVKKRDKFVVIGSGSAGLSGNYVFIEYMVYQGILLISMNIHIIWQGPQKDDIFCMFSFDSFAYYGISAYPRIDTYGSCAIFS